jgi:hypothetical protein
MKAILCLVSMIGVSLCAQEAFIAGGAFTTCRQPVAMAVGDLNNDGTPDVVVCGRSSNYQNGVVAVMYGAGDGTLRDRLEFPTDEFPVYVQLIDVHKDGLSDIIVAHDNKQSVGVLANVNLGGFKVSEETKIKMKPYIFSTGHFNKDADPDLAVASQETKELQIFRGAGKGEFKFVASHALPHKPLEMKVADFSGQGLSHLLIRMEGTTAVSLVAPTEKSGKWEFPSVTFDMLTSPLFSKIGDIDGDGTDDAVILKTNEAELQVVYGEGDGLFLDKTYAIPTVTTATSFALADFNRDGKLDIAVLDPTNEQVKIYLNQHETDAKTRYDPDKCAVIYSADFSKTNSADVGMLSSYPSVSMLLYDQDGNLVRSYFDFNSDLPEGQFGLEWNGTDENDRSVADGNYVFYYKLGSLVVTRIIKK